MKTRWYKNSVIYQIYPFSYKDSNGDGVGDINGIIEKLDYIRDLGVTAIWFSPLYKSPNKDYGYDIEDYYKISETFGTEEEFKRLIEECHKRGLKVIMDSVFNHTSDKHQWFLDAINNKDSKYRDYYIIRKGIKKGKKLLPPNNWTASFTGSAWERIKDTDEFYLHLFTKEQPDLNWENEEVRNEVIKVFNHYFDLGVDGFRMDVFNVFSKVQTFENTKHKSISGGGAEYFVDGPRMHEFLHELNVKSFSKYDSFIVGESFRSSEEHSSRYVDEKNEEIDALFNFSHLSSDAHMGAAFLRKKFDIIEFKKGLIDPMVKDYSHGWHTLVLENHDVPRSISRFGLDSKNYHHEVAKLLPIVTFLGYGIPFIYEGEEIGIDNHPFNSIDECKDPVSHFIYKITKKIPMPNKTRMKIISNGARDNARRPMQWNGSKFGGFSSVEPWQCVNPDYKEVNVAADLNSPDSLYRFYQQLLNLKKSNQTLIYGNIKEYNREDKNTVSYLRFDENNKILVLGNFKKKEVLYKIPEELLNKEYQVLISNYNELNIKNGYIVLKPYEAMAISISNYKKELSYGAVIYSENNGKREFLLEKMGLGHTSLPKGHIENGETPIKCVKREIREELGINDIEIDSTFSNTITYSPKLNVIKDVVFYTAKVDRDVKITIDNNEVVDYMWKEYDDAIALLTHDSDKETLTKHNNYLNGEK